MRWVSSNANGNRPFPHSLVPLFLNESKCESFHVKMSSVCSFIFMQISYFHKNGIALRLALKQRHKGTRKWPIISSVFNNIPQHEPPLQARSSYSKYEYGLFNCCYLYYRCCGKGEIWCNWSMFQRAEKLNATLTPLPGFMTSMLDSGMQALGSSPGWCHQGVTTWCSLALHTIFGRRSGTLRNHNGESHGTLKSFTLLITIKSIAKLIHK